jgi:hypothetical protein
LFAEKYRVIPSSPCCLWRLSTWCDRWWLYGFPRAFLYRKRPPQQNGDRGKRHSTGTRGLGHSCFARGYCVSQAAQVEWRLSSPPPLPLL